MATVTLERQPFTFVRRFVTMFGLGLIGILALAFASLPALQQAVAARPELARMPFPALVALSMLSPTVLLLLAALLGSALAPRLGLRSHLAEGTATWPVLRRELPLALVGGALFSLAIIAVDVVSRPLLPAVKPGAEALLNSVSHTSLPGVLAAVLYGGLTEEVLLRWGMLALLAWLGWRVVQRGQGQPNAAIMWLAIGLSALLFGLGHLPAAAQVWGLTPLVVGRTVLLNAVFGLFAGWLFWRRSLEASMAAHMATHVTTTLVSLLLVNLVR